MNDSKHCYWIVGASSGIGKALAIELDSKGHDLILSARSEGKLNALNNDLFKSHTVIPLDISNQTSIIQAIDTVHSQERKLDSVILLAGIYTPNPIKEMDINDIKHTIDTNFTGMVLFIQHILPVLKQHSPSQIAICSSVAAYRGLPNGQIYSATKAALTNFTESLKIETKEDDIDVKLISPGFVKTPLTDKNEFNMPMMISAETAAQEIAIGLRKKAFEIHFPKRFTYLMKVLQLIPYSLFFYLIKNQSKK